MNSDAFSPSAPVIAQWLTENIASLAQLPTVQIDADTPVIDFGIESLALLGLAGDLAAWLGRDISPTLLWEYPTITALAQHLDEVPAMARRALVTLQTRGVEPPFVLIHALGGSLATYRYLVDRLGQEQNIVGFEVPFDEDESERIESIEALAALYLAELQAHQPKGPYFLGGYSLGGLLAFEMACQLRAQGETIGLLVLMDTMFPASKRRPDNLCERITVGWERIRVRVHTFLELSPLQKRAYLSRHLRRAIARLRNSVLAPDETTLEALFQSPISARLMDVSQLYRPRHFDGSLVFLRAGGRSRTASDDVMAWRRVVRGKVFTRRVSGQHESVTRLPNAKNLAAQLRRILRRARSPK